MTEALAKRYPRRADIIKARKELFDALATVRHAHTAFKEYIKKIRANHLKHYVTWSLDEPMQVSFSSNRSVHRFNDSQRTRSTLGRYMRRRLGYKGDDYALDCFVAAVLKAMPVSHRFRRVKGDDIRVAYQRDIGGSSCMTGHEANEKLDIYVNTPDAVSLLLYKDHKMTARALVWETTDGATCVDRIYPNSGYHIGMFEKYCDEQGWLMRPHQSLPDGPVAFDYRHRCVEVNGNGHSYPYLDSFYSTSDDPREEGRMILTTDSNDAGYRFWSTGGGWEAFQRCHECGDRLFDEGRSYDGNPFCERCFSENYRECACCGNTAPQDDTVDVGNGEACSTCADNATATCSCCGELVWVYHMYPIFGRLEMYCSQCHGGGIRARPDSPSLLTVCPECRRSNSTADCECGVGLHSSVALTQAASTVSEAF